MKKIDMEHLEAAEHISASYAVSLAGELPAGEKERFDVAPEQMNTGESFSVGNCDGEFSFTPGYEKWIHKLYFVVGVCVAYIQDVVFRKFREYCERVKMTVRSCSPEFLRL